MYSIRKFQCYFPMRVTEKSQKCGLAWFWRGVERISDGEKNLDIRSVYRLIGSTWLSKELNEFGDWQLLELHECKGGSTQQPWVKSVFSAKKRVLGVSVETVKPLWITECPSGLKVH